MNSTTWQCLYDLAGPDAARLIDTAWALGAVLVVALLWWRPRSMPLRFASVMAVVALAAVGARAWDRHQTLAAWQAGRVLVAQGPLTGYATEQQAWRRTGETTWRRTTLEAFTVGGVRFGYAQDTAAPGFRNLSEPRWTPNDGEWLRVHYVETAPDDPMSRRILRLERRAP